MSGFIGVMKDIIDNVYVWWTEFIFVDGVPLLTWLFAIWAFGLVITAIHAFAGLGFPSVSGSLMHGVEAGRYLRSNRSANHRRTVMWDSIYRNASEEDKDSYFDNR